MSKLSSTVNPCNTGFIWI